MFKPYYKDKIVRKDFTIMLYRKLPHGNEQISVLGMGTSVVGEVSEKNVVETIIYALDHNQLH